MHNFVNFYFLHVVDNFLSKTFTQTNVSCEILTPLQLKRNYFYRPSSYRAVNTLHLGYEKLSVKDVRDKSRCLF
jgi:hypothetical protein